MYPFFRPLVSVAVAAAVLTAPVIAQNPDNRDRVARPRGDELTPELQDAIQRGLEWLASRQQPDGSFGGREAYGARTAVASLAALAFMSNGSLPGRGPYGENVERALNFILETSQENGLLVADQGYGLMYNHGFAALFLAEVYGTTGDERVREKLNRAVRLIMRAQNSEGGWRYQPVPLDADSSVTILQVMALRAARDVGVKVEADVIERAIDYIKRCQNADGGFNYMLGSGGSAFPRSAAGVATLFYAGIYDGPEIERGLKYLMQFLPGAPNANRNQGHYFYGQYYAAQAMFLAGGEYWAQWFPAIRAELLGRQNKARGSWGGDVSEEYATAMALIILQIPKRYLPVFAGKGEGG